MKLGLNAMGAVSRTPVAQARAAAATNCRVRVQPSPLVPRLPAPQIGGVVGLAVGLLYFLQEKIVSWWLGGLHAGAMQGPCCAGSSTRTAARSSPAPPMPPRLLQLYVPRLPGIPNDYPYYPDAFRLAYEDVW